MKTYRRLLVYAQPLGSFMVPYFFVAVTGQLFGMMNFMAVVPLLDSLFGIQQAAPPPKENTGFADQLKEDYYTFFDGLIAEEGQLTVLYGICIFVLCTMFLSSTFKYLSLVLLEKLKAKVIKNLRIGLYNKSLLLDVGYFTEKKKGDLISRSTNDIYEVEFSVTNSLSTFLKDPIMIIIYFGVLFFMSTKMTLFTLFIIPIAGFGISFLVKKLKKSANITQESIAHITTHIDESLWGIRIIKAFKAIKFKHNAFEELASGYESKYKKFAFRRELASPFSEVLGTVVVITILGFGGRLVLEDNFMRPAEFIMFIVIFSQILAPGKAIGNAISRLQRGLISADRILEIIDADVAIKEKEGAESLEAFKEEITYNNVHFKYNEVPVINGINFHVKSGQMVALVGPSGGGKSTLVDLLPRYYDTEKGSITLDGHDIKDLTLDSLREHIGIVSQESILFNDTITNNIAFGDENPDLEKVKEAARIANAKSFIEEMELGYESNIGDRGQKLSGGQRQRISIARAVYKNPAILILDEATSALDSESEKLVQEALENLMQNRTSIVIAHRLSTIKNADKIIVIDKGMVVEEGTHEALMAQGGLYTKLKDLQN